MGVRVISQLYRRAILIYVVTIVIPVAVFLWLGVRSFEQQRLLLVARTSERLATELQRETRQAATRAFDSTAPPHPLIQHRFILERGVVVEPVLDAPLPDPIPESFIGAYHLEVNRPDLAIEAYRRLLHAKTRPSLALQGIARCLDRLGDDAAARETWRRLASEYPDDRTLSHQPYGIFAAIKAGETAGLFEEIASGRWALAGDHAQHFLEALDSTRTSSYLDRYRFARELKEQFRPPRTLGERDIYDDELGSHRVFYRAGGAERIVGFSVNDKWIEETLRPQLARQLNVEAATRRDQTMYAGSVTLVILVLSAGVVLLLRDVSRESRTNQARAELVSGVSHELKTPITLVRLYSETLLRHKDFTEEDRIGFYRIMARESTRLGRLVDQVLTFSRVDRGAQSYHFEDGDVNAVVTGVVDDYREYIEHAGFRVRCSIPPELPPVRIDESAISQALLNLLDNAVKYSGSSRDILVTVAGTSDAVAIEVEDHGLGIDASEQAKIFERFYRAENGAGKGGYGLGLFLVRHIVEAHGGRAEVDSEPGRGSRFRLILPVAAA